MTFWAVFKAAVAAYLGYIAVGVVLFLAVMACIFIVACISVILEGRRDARVRVARDKKRKDDHAR